MAKRCYVAAYVQQSLDPEVQSPEEQERTIREYCERVGLELSGVYLDPASSSRSPLSDRVAGRKLQEHLRRGQHVVAASVDRIANNLREAAVTLDGWYRRGITVHLLDPLCRIDHDDPGCQAFIELILGFAQAASRMVAIRNRTTAASLGSKGRRRSGRAPFGIEFVKRDGKSYLAEEPAEQAVRRRVLELNSQGYSID
jgi:DNA invertase Pin-like site-specific DNA recombinase